MKQLLILLSLGSILCSYSQSVTTVTLGASEDTYTYSGAPSSNYYTSLTTPVYVDGSLHYYRGFTKFSLSSIPANAVIVSATMRFTPSGTENVTATNSTQLYLDVCASNWSHTTLTHSHGIIPNTAIPTVTVSNLNPVNSKREFNVTNQVQAIVDKRIQNYGWMLRRNPENTTSLTTNYRSLDAINPAPRPVLEVMYYKAAYISAATIVHANSSTSSDGSISPTILEGSSGTRSYQWYNSAGIISGATSLNLSGKPFGWYGLKSWGTTAGDTLFQAFIIGAKCEMVAISFNPGPNYIDDAVIHNLVSGGIDYSQFNNPTSQHAAEQWTVSGNWLNKSSLVRFKIWIDAALEVNEAMVTYYGAGHSPLSRPNDSKLTLVDSVWKETGVAYINRPALGSLSLNVPNMPTGNGNSVLDWKDFFNFWKTNNLLNRGLDFSLQSYPDPGIRTKQFYESSDQTNKPWISFKVSLVNSSCDFTSYSRFKDALDGAFVRTTQGKLKIQFQEDYDQKTGRFTKLVLYDAANNQIKAGINNDGSMIGPALLPAKLLEFDYNQYLLDLTTYSLTTGKDYILELTNSAGEKTFIKFKYFN